MPVVDSDVAQQVVGVSADDAAADLEPKAESESAVVNGNADGAEEQEEDKAEANRAEPAGKGSDECSPHPGDDTFLSACSYEEKEELISSLKKRLALAEMELELKSERCGKLQEMQESLDKEIQELTASLFQEAYRIAKEANDKRTLTEKLLKEANGKVEMLQAEVDALKIIVLASNVSLNASQQPNKKQSSSEGKSSKLMFLTHKRNASDTSSVVKKSSSYDQCLCSFPESHEIDPLYHKELSSWKEKCDLVDKEHPFLRRIYAEDILPCLNFVNTQLGERVMQAIENNTIILEPVSVEEKAVARACALTGVPRLCSYRMKMDNDDEWLHISTLCRNRIASVCDFFMYLRYLKQGLIKRGLQETYWEVVRLRQKMALGRLGLGQCSSCCLHCSPQQDDEGQTR